MNKSQDCRCKPQRQFLFRSPFISKLKILRPKKASAPAEAFRNSMKTKINAVTATSQAPGYLFGGPLSSFAPSG